MIVTPASEIDPASAPELAEALEACDPTERNGVDFAEVVFCDSSGLRVLVAEHQRHLDAGGRLLVLNASEKVARIFEITGLTELLDEGAERS
ncbi:MAG: STAS domain-containing protein [Acidimicrobiia bacterium]|nr:STAS domain-containing protein [Acidimicrobiia bacterium]